MQRGTSHRRRLFAGSALLCAIVAAIATAHWATASDHRDSALLTANPSEDIADIYSFQSPATPGNFVLAMTVNGFIPPPEAGTTYFDPDVLYQFKIDNNADAVEDLVLQAFVTGTGADQVMHFYGPVAPAKTGAVTRVTGPETASVKLSTGATPTIGSGNGMTVFAGVRDDPFFFDLAQFKLVVGGQATAFNNPGTDTFAGNNVLAIVVELPTSALGSSSTIGVWGTTSR
jgi:hypothetical protein